VPYEELFSWGTRHHCPVEVGAYAVVSGSVVKYLHTKHMVFVTTVVSGQSLVTE